MLSLYIESDDKFWSVNNIRKSYKMLKINVNATNDFKGFR